MAESSGFFNSSNGDRKYKAEFFAKYFASFIGNGVFPNPSTNLQVMANNDMTVTVKAGLGWINGYIYINDSDLVLPIDIADGVLNRIDRIVLQYNTVDRIITAKIKKGTFASSPVALSLQRDADAYELGLADVYIAAGATSIIQVNITDLRLDATKCGIVHGVVNQVDPTTIFNQYQSWFNSTKNASQTEIDNMEAQFQSDFNVWFDTVKNTLGSDVAGNLLNQINSLSGIGRTTENVKGNADTIASLNQQFTSHEADYMYQIPQISGTQIRINKLSNTNRLFFKLDSDLTGAITISTDGGSTSMLLKDVDGNTVTNLEKGFIEVIADANFFILRNRGISATQKQQLIDIVNNAVANQSDIKTNIANALNIKAGSSLTNSSSWMDIQNVINNLKNRKNGTATSDSSGFITVTGLSFKPSIILIKNPTYNGQTGKDWSFYFSSSSPISSSDEFFRIDSSSSIYSVTGNSISSSGFTLKVSSNSTNYKWIAFE